MFSTLTESDETKVSKVAETIIEIGFPEISNYGALLESKRRDYELHVFQPASSCLINIYFDEGWELQSQTWTFTHFLMIKKKWNTCVSIFQVRCSARLIITRRKDYYVQEAVYHALQEGGISHLHPFPIEPSS